MIVREMTREKLHYEDSGDNYSIKDPFKIWAQKAASNTAHNLDRFSNYGLQTIEVSRSRGESAYRIKIIAQGSIDFEIATVEEGAGTKPIPAHQLEELYGKKLVYRNIGIDNVASILNDLSTTGAAPLTFMLHIGAFPTEWYTDQQRAEALLEGTSSACNLAQASWGGGESATLRGIIQPNEVILSGSATGLIIPSKKALTEEKIEDGDRIILLGSSGVHTNGITLLWTELLERLPQGYQTKLSGGQSYGESLLTPSIIYSSLVEEVVNLTEIHYAVHITGHGFRKLMRPRRSFSYIIQKLLPPQPIFSLIQKYANLTDRQMYDSYNMGAGFALYLPTESIDKVLELAKKYNIPALDAGFIKKGEIEVRIEPLNIKFRGRELIIR